MRDLLFICSSIDFGFELWKQSKAQDPSFTGIRHYDFNQSMVTPLFHGAGMPYLGVVHGSDLDYIYNNMFPRDQMSEQDRQLSDAMVASFVNFAYTGNPSGSHSLSQWPESFSEASASLSELQLQLIGGPWGTGTCHLKSGLGQTAEFAMQDDSMQSPLVDSLQFGQMPPAILQRRQQELDREKLLERCSFINSLGEKLGH